MVKAGACSGSFDAISFRRAEKVSRDDHGSYCAALSHILLYRNSILYSAEELREMFNISAEMTPEEEAAAGEGRAGWVAEPPATEGSN